VEGVRASGVGVGGQQMCMARACDGWMQSRGGRGGAHEH
jgi:hypothetical protein